MKPSLIYERNGHGSSISLVKKRASKKTAIATAYKTGTLDWDLANVLYITTTEGVLTTVFKGLDGYSVLQ